MTVIKHFEEISKIPRGSGNEKGVSDFIAAFARKLGHSAAQDSRNNLIIYKAGSAGNENKPPVILQAHLDMVCEKNADTAFDFAHDPINIFTDGDFLKARGTTLGADNGIGVAMCMAILESKGVHPPLEIVLTTEEETGMDGAENLDVSQLNGRRLINLDSSDETTFTMGCAAGTTAEFTLPTKWIESAESNICEITVKGLKGGHSGGDIDTERGNALRILGFLLNALDKKIGIRLAKINGGMKVNAIPREASATVIFPVTGATKEQATAILNVFAGQFSEQFSVSDPDLSISWVFSTGKLPYMIADGTQKLISALLLLPNGVTAKSLEIEGLVTASNNIGVAETTDESIKLSMMPRGAAAHFVWQVETQISALAAMLGAEAKFVSRSPAWPFNPQSELLKTAMEVYPRIFGGLGATPTAVHGGLECGIFLEKFKPRALDIISFGPNAYDYHTPDERVSISSVERVWEFLVALLEVL